jgi:hypothetical protein
MIRRKFFFENNKLLISFFQRLYFPKQIYDDDGNYYQDKILKIRGFNCFLVDRYYRISATPSGRFTVSPVWDMDRIKSLRKRILG